MSLDDIDRLTLDQLDVLLSAPKEQTTPVRTFAQLQAILGGTQI
jgi:hypothetical protein